MPSADRFIDVRINVVDNTKLEQFELAVDETIPPVLTAIGEVVAGAAQARAAVGITGLFRSGITNSGAERSGTGWSVDVYSQGANDYAPVQEGVNPETGEDTEFGRRPGAAFPNIAAVKLWVDRVIAPDDGKLDEVTFLVGRAIVQRGLPKEGDPHFRPIETAFIENRQFIDEEIDRALDEALAKI